MMKKGRYRGRCLITTRKTVNERVVLHLGKIRRIYRVDRQKICTKLFDELDALFNLAFSIAQGRVKRLRDDEGNEYRVSFPQRQKWAQLATVTAQVMQSLNQGFDEKEFQTDLHRLEKIADEIRRKTDQEKTE